MSDELIHATDSGGVRTLQLYRPDAYNALSRPLMSALMSALADAAEVEDVHAVILHGSGRGFCAGHDLRELRAEQDPGELEALFSECSELMQAVVRSPKPVIAAVHGVATAAGCQLVASCDLAVATRDARFATPGVNIGLFCATPMVALSRAVPRKRALEMLLLGEFVDAETALDMGLLNRVVDPDDLLPTAQALGERIASRAPEAIRTGKALFTDQLEMTTEEAYQQASLVMARSMLGDEAPKGIDAMLEGKPKQWR